MKHTNIGKVLKWEEVPDVEEIHLQPEEASAIDRALGSIETNASAAADLVTANQTISDRDNTIVDLQTQVSTAQTTNSTQASRIQELEAEVTRLGGQSSGQGTTITTTADPDPQTGKVVSLNSPDHPVNRYVTRVVQNSKK